MTKKEFIQMLLEQNGVFFLPRRLNKSVRSTLVTLMGSRISRLYPNKIVFDTETECDFFAAEGTQEQRFNGRRFDYCVTDANSSRYTSLGNVGKIIEFHQVEHLL
jgi:hypothetical protein